jgi:hypothetical protein
MPGRSDTAAMLSATMRRLAGISKDLEIVDVLLQCEMLDGDAIGRSRGQMHVQIDMPMGREGNAEGLRRAGHANPFAHPTNDSHVGCSTSAALRSRRWLNSQRVYVFRRSPRESRWRPIRDKAAALKLLKRIFISRAIS